MNAKKEMTYKSIEQAVDNGAKTMSQIAVAHGYKRPISSGTIRKIRRISPMVYFVFFIRSLFLKA